MKYRLLKEENEKLKARVEFLNNLINKRRELCYTAYRAFQDGLETLEDNITALRKNEFTAQGMILLDKTLVKYNEDGLQI